MEPDEFRRILNIGLGRAVLHLRDHDSAAYQDAILDACLHNTAYDPQVEGTRASYLHDVIRYTSNYEFYRDQIVAGLAQTSPAAYWDRQQLVWLTVQIAEEGFQPARDVLYQQFVWTPADVADALLALDGSTALTFMSNHAGDYDWFDEYNLLPLEKYFPKDLTTQSLADATRQNSDFQAKVLAALEALQQPRNRNRRLGTQERQNKYHISYAELRAALANEDRSKSSYGFLRSWGMYAPDAELRSAARDLVQESDDKRLLHLVTIFANRRFPLDPTRLISIVNQHGDRATYDENGRWTDATSLCIRALAALRHVQHPDVRALALRLIDTTHWSGRGVELLSLNFENDDWTLIGETARRARDRDVAHSMGFGVQAVFRTHPSSEAADALIAVYERNPCSQCRERAVEALHSLSLLPPNLLEECKFDANFDLRERARRNFAPLED